MSNPERNAETTTTRQYRDSRNLQARAALHTQYGTGSLDWFAWVFDHLLTVRGTDILEVGTGPALLWSHNEARLPSAWRVTLTDQSAGMVAEARAALAHLPNLRFERADVQELPFEMDRFDVVIANHMLYHVPDLKRGLGEIRRVLREGGALLAATNGSDHMAELERIARIAFPEALARLADRSAEMSSFTLENAGQRLGEVFEHVERFDASSPLEVPDAEPLVAYVASVGGLEARLAELPAGERDVLIGTAVDRVAAWIEREGPARITRATGLLVAR